MYRLMKGRRVRVVTLQSSICHIVFWFQVGEHLTIIQEPYDPPERYALVMCRNSYGKVQNVPIDCLRYLNNQKVRLVMTEREKNAIAKQKRMGNL